MKKLILISTFAIITAISCNHKTGESTETATEIIDSMPAIDVPADTVKEDTVPVVKKAEIDKIYSCPMHPDVKGKQNSKCSKCGMDLTELVK